MDQRPVVLVVDDDPGCRRALRRVLDFAGLETVACPDLAEARKALADHSPPCVVTEFRLPDGQGVDFLSSAMESDEHVGRIMLTGVVDFVAVQEAVNQGSVHAFFTKPWDNDSLVQGVRSVMEQCRLARENASMMLRLSDQNRALEATVNERTAQLEQAKRELEAVFDSWDDPVSIVGGDKRLVRVNRSFAHTAGLDVKSIPGRTCHEALFDAVEPCRGCPAFGEIAPHGEKEATVENDGRAFRVTARPLDLGGGGVAMLCRYRPLK